MLPNTKKSFPLDRFMMVLCLIGIVVVILLVRVALKKATPTQDVRAGTTSSPAAPPELIEQAEQDGANWQMAFVKVTAYCPCTICCGDWALTDLLERETASGTPLKPLIDNNIGFVAAAVTIPFGTKLQVPGYNDNNPVYVLDRGGAIDEGDIDVFFPTHQEALNWGVKHMWILVFTDPPKGTMDYKAKEIYARSE